MLHVCKLTPKKVDTVEQQHKCKRKLTAELYDSLLAEFSPGDYGEVALERSENRSIVRNRLHLAAARRGLTLTFLHARRTLFRFRVELLPETSAERSTTSAANLSHQPSDLTLASHDATSASRVESDEIARRLRAVQRRRIRAAAVRGVC